MQNCKLSLNDLNNEDTFTEIDFRGCDFLTNTYLSHKTFESCNFSNCNLTGVDLYNAELSNSDLTGSNLSNASLKDTGFTATNLTGANLTGVDATDAFFIKSVLTGVNLTKANLKRANINLTNFEDSILINSDFTESDLTGSDFTHANLTGSFLIGADLSEANLTASILSGADLTGANLTGANLTGANLTGANLTDADLTGANLTGANLSNSVLTGTNLIYTLLDNANFTNVKSSGQSQIREQILKQEQYKPSKTRKVSKSRKQSSKITNNGYNPMTNEYQNVSEWLKNKNNLVFIIDGKPLCLTRDLLGYIQMNYILYPCDISERKYVKNVTINELSFIDIGKYNLIDNTVINYENFRNTINETRNQVFLINITNTKTALFNEETIVNINIFNKVLLEYSKNIIYKEITEHLLNGKELTSENMKNISYIDQCFMEYAQITKDNDMIVYRGMKKPYGIKKGESMIILNYLSTTINKNPNVINVFQDDDFYTHDNHKHLKPKAMPQHINNCCVYEIKIEKGTPFIDMRYSTETESEREILFPRNLLITCTGGYVSTNPEMYITTMVIKKMSKNQFKSVKRKQCSEFNEATITPFDINIIERISTTKKDKKMTRKTMKTYKSQISPKNITRKSITPRI